MDLVMGAAMGFVYVALPGPVTLETLRRGLLGGVGVALGVQVGATLGRAMYAMLALAGAGIVLTHPGVRMLLGVVGAGAMIALSWRAVREGWTGLRRGAPQPDADEGPAGKGSFRTLRQGIMAGALISLTNPASLAFWFSLGSAMLRSGQHQAALVMGAFWAGVAIWALAFSLLVGWSGTVLDRRLFPAISLVCGLGLVFFGLGAGHAALA